METYLKYHIRIAIAKLKDYYYVQDPHQTVLMLVNTLPTEHNLIIVINKLLSIEFKNVYQSLIIMSLICDILSVLINFSEVKSNQFSKITQFIIPKAITMLRSANHNNKQNEYQLYIKKLELIKILIEYEISKSNLTIQYYTILSNILDSLEMVQSNLMKQYYKITFINIYKMILKDCKDDSILDFIFNRFFQESCTLLDNKNKNLPHLMRVIDLRIQVFREFASKGKIKNINLHKIVFLLAKMNKIENIYITNLCTAITEIYLPFIIQQSSILTYITLCHVYINPLIKYATKGHDAAHLEIYLGFFLNLFQNQQLLFKILKDTEIHIYREGIIYNLISYLYDYVEKHSGIINDLIKNHLKLLIQRVNQILTKKKNLEQECGIEQIKRWQNLQNVFDMKKKTYKANIEEFNMQPKNFLKKFKNANNSEIQIQQFVHFLKKSPHINAQKMIEVLGQPDQISNLLLEKYIATFKFLDYSLQQALRIFLSNFFLIGQSQQINRVIEKFTLKYHEQQKVHSWDSVYCLASALMILNTDLHNPMNESKMTHQGFTKMCSNIHGIGSVDLLEIYSSISKNKIENFRNFNYLENINLSCFLYFTNTQKDTWTMSYLDRELKEIELDSKFQKWLSYKVLQNVIIGKEIDRVNKLVQNFVYKQDVYECEILIIIQKLIEHGKEEIPKLIYDQINTKISFLTDQIDQKYLSYFWLLSKIIKQHFNLIPIQKICNFIILSFPIRLELHDDFYSRCQLKIKRIKESSKIYQNKQQKVRGSILNVFSFLSQKEESQEQIQIKNLNKNYLLTFKKLCLEIYELICDNKDIILAIKLLIKRIGQPNVQYELFLCILYMLYDLVYRSLHIQCFKISLSIFETIILQKKSPLRKRLNDLKKKSEIKYSTILNLSRYYLLRILLQFNQQLQNYKQLFEASTIVLQFCTKDLLYQFIIKLRSMKNFVEIKEIGVYLDKLIYKIYVNFTQNKIDSLQIQQFINEFVNNAEHNIWSRSQMELPVTQINQIKNNKKNQQYQNLKSINNCTSIQTNANTQQQISIISQQISPQIINKEIAYQQQKMILSEQESPKDIKVSTRGKQQQQQKNKIQLDEQNVARKQNNKQENEKRLLKEQTQELNKLLLINQVENVQDLQIPIYML